MQGVGDDEQYGGDIYQEDEEQSRYLQAPFVLAEIDRLVPVQGYPHQAQAGDVDAGSLKISNYLDIITT